MNNTLVNNYVSDLLVSLDGSDVVETREFVTEAVFNNSAGTARLIERLYREVMNSGRIDIGDIPKSYGDIVKLGSYKQAMECVAVIDELLITKDIKEVQLMHDVHVFLINEKDTFVYGYKYDIPLIKSMYAASVLAFYELIDMCIVAYTMYMKDPDKKDFKFQTFGKMSSIVVTSTSDLIVAYKSGDWDKVVKELKTPKVAAVGEGAYFISMGAELRSTDTIAQESSFLDLAEAAANKASKFMDNNPAVKNVKNVALIGTLSITAFIVILNLIRSLIKFFFVKAGKFSTYIQNQAEFLSTAIDAQRNADSSDEKAIKSQEKMRNNLTELSEFIETKILKTNKAAEKEIKESNQRNYTAKALSNDEDYEIF